MTRRDGMSGERGFTLIELLVVVTIIGILAAVVSVGVGGFTTTAGTKAKQAKAASVQTAVDLKAGQTLESSNATTPDWTQVANLVNCVGSGIVTANDINAAGSGAWYDSAGDPVTATALCAAAAGGNVPVVKIWDASGGFVTTGLLRQNAIGTGTAVTSSSGAAANRGFNCILDGSALSGSGVTTGKIKACTDALKQGP